MRKLVYKFIVLINIVAILPLLLAYVSIYISPAKIWFPAFFGLAYPYFLVLNILFVIFWIYHKKWVLLLSLGIILLGWNYFGNTFQVNFKNVEHVQGSTFKLLSYNVRLLDKYNWSNDKNTPQNLVDYIYDEKADIICLQEVPGKRNNKPDLKLLSKVVKGNKYNYSSNKKSNIGVITISKYPIISKGTIQFKNSNNVGIYTDLKINNITYRVYNVHLQSIYLDPSAYKLLDSLDFQQKKRNLKEAGDILSHLKKAYKLRAEQADEIARHIDQSPFPVIVTGDFNDTPVSYSYHTISKGLCDAFIESGSGISNTYIGKFPSFRIDYILHTNALRSTNYEVEHVKYSDHYPIYCNFALK